MRIFAASALLALTLSTPVFAWEHWSIVRDNSHRIVAGPFPNRGACERVLHRNFRERYNHCAIT
jgi:hypothetical protein